MDSRIRALMDFLDASHSVYHAVAYLENVLKEAGYTCLMETDAWELAPGGKYYMTRGGSAILAFRVPNAGPKGFVISASHSDRPTFKVKENGEITTAYTKLATEKYGGMLMAPWMDRPLSIAGRVLVENENGNESKLLDIDRAADKAEKLALIENQLQDATQIICDIYSRFRFEAMVFENRES